MIYTSAIYATADESMVTGTDAEGDSETVKATHFVFRCPNEGPVGFVRSTDQGGVGGSIAPYVEPTPAPVIPQPSLFAAVAVLITDGAISVIEQAAQLQGAGYEDGWLMVWFAQPLNAADYLVFAQSDVPARIDQYKSASGFELVFSDANGAPINPGRIDIQILKVR